jgi:hypothetical protein
MHISIAAAYISSSVKMRTASLIGLFSEASSIIFRAVFSAFAHLPFPPSSDCFQRLEYGLRVSSSIFDCEKFLQGFPRPKMLGFAPELFAPSSPVPVCISVIFAVSCCWVTRKPSRINAIDTVTAQTVRRIIWERMTFCRCTGRERSRKYAVTETIAPDQCWGLMWFRTELTDEASPWPHSTQLLQLPAERRHQSSYQEVRDSGYSRVSNYYPGSSYTA